MNYRETRQKQNKIDSLKERLTRIESELERVTACLSRTRKNKDARDRISKLLAIKDEVESQITEMVLEQEYYYREIEVRISDLPDRHKMIMRMRYIDGRRWQEVSDLASYSIRHCTRLHREAIMSLNVHK